MSDPASKILDRFRSKHWPYNGAVPYTPLDVLRTCRCVVEEGGDPRPCERGTYCLGCCLALAKGRLDDAYGIESHWSDIACFPGYFSNDYPLMDAAALVKATGYDGAPADRDGALALLERVIAEADGLPGVRRQP